MGFEVVVTKVGLEGRVVEEAEVEVEMSGVGDVKEEEVEAVGF